MNFSYAKQMALRPEKERRLSTFLIALGVAAGFILPYTLLGEGYFLFYGDFNVQQIPFYQMCHAAVRDGNIGWNWLTDLGANFIGSYSFYLLGSPFFWITLIFPNSWVPYLMGPLLVIKFALSALTGYLFIRRFTRTPAAAQLGGLLYAFSGFSIYNIFFNHFHEAIIMFPLLLLSLELLITENRRGIFMLTVCLSALVNYFFFFGMVVFTVIYFFVRLLSGAIKIRPARFITVAFEAILGVGLAAILLVPSFYAVIDNSRVSNILLGWSGITYGKEQIYLNIIECFFFPPDLPARPVFFPGAQVKWSSLGGWLPLFSMAGVFTWFITQKKSWIKRIIGICIFMALVPILNSAFYAFNTSYYARWFYMPILIMSLATVILTEDPSVDWGAGFRWTVGVTAAFALTIGFFPQKDENDKLIFGLYSQSEDGMYIARFWLTVLIAAVSLIILGLVLKLLKKERSRFHRAAIICTCIITLIYANVYVALGKTHSYENDVMIDSLIEGDVDLGDGDFRIDVYSGVDNTGMYLGYPAINAFHSIVPSAITDFYEYIGEERTVGSRPSTEISAIRPLLSVKYLLNRTGGDSFIDDTGEPQMAGYKYIRTEGGYYIYENQNYIPYGFSYDYYMTDEFCAAYSESSRANLMLKAILLSDEQIKKYGHCFESIETLRGGALFDTDNDISLNITDDAITKDAERLRKTAADSFEVSKNGFRATVSRDSETLVFFSVPYDKGWSATVNGKPVEVERVNVGFMAVPVGEGESHIVFTYETEGLSLGIIITLGAIGLAIIYLLAARIFISRLPCVSVYPEGDRLIEKWRSDSISEQILSRSDEELFDTPDEEPKIEIPKLNQGFEGGFKIDPKAFDE